jgi:hypothetical protein
VPCADLPFASHPDWNQLRNFVDWPLTFFQSTGVFKQWQELTIFPSTATWVEASKLGDIHLCYSAVAAAPPCETIGNTTASRCKYKVNVVSWVGTDGKAETNRKMFEDVFEFVGVVVSDFDASFRRFVTNDSSLDVAAQKNMFAQWVANELFSLPAQTIISQYAAARLWSVGPDFAQAGMFVRNDLASPGNSYYIDAEILSGEKMIIRDTVKIAFPTEYDGNTALRRSLGDEGLIDRSRLTSVFGCIGLETVNKGECSKEDRTLTNEIILHHTKATITAASKRDLGIIAKAIRESKGPDVDPLIQVALRRLEALDLVYHLNAAKRIQGKPSPSVLSVEPVEHR